MGDNFDQKVFEQGIHDPDNAAACNLPHVAPCVGAVLPPARIQNQPQRRATLGGQDILHTNYKNQMAIVPPTIQSQHYKIKPHIIALVKQNQFHGLPTRNLMEHIVTFEEICSMTSLNGISLDYLRCKPFPFTLSEKRIGG